MHLVSLNLKNFRNYRNQQISFHPQLNYLVGKNAQGKTNLLEAVYYLGYLDTFREGGRNDLILKGKAEGVVSGEAEHQGVKKDYRIRLTPEERETLVNGKKIWGAKKDLLPVILFDSREVYLFRDSPGKRRKFIDHAVCLNDPSMADLVRDYEKIISQKNRLIKEFFQKTPPDELAVWNEQLKKVGSKITFRRMKWLEEVNTKLPFYYHTLSEGDEEIFTRYHFRAVSGKEMSLHGLSEGDILSLLDDALREIQAGELARGESLVGPHRDDWTVFCRGQELGTFGSQGENRTVLMALKKVQSEIFEKTHGFVPILLLDDVTSELDSQRCAALFSLVENMRGQAFLTTTKAIDNKGLFGRSGTSFLVEEGQVHVIN